MVADIWQLPESEKGSGEATRQTGHVHGCCTFPGGHQVLAKARSIAGLAQGAESEAGQTQVLL